jgi:hypothetical protein
MYHINIIIFKPVQTFWHRLCLILYRNRKTATDKNNPIKEAIMKRQHLIIAICLCLSVCATGALAHNAAKQLPTSATETAPPCQVPNEMSQVPSELAPVYGNPADYDATEWAPVAPSYSKPNLTSFPSDVGIYTPMPVTPIYQLVNFLLHKCF